MLYGVFGIVVVCLSVVDPSSVTDVLWLAVKACGETFYAVS